MSYDNTPTPVEVPVSHALRHGTYGYGVPVESSVDPAVNINRVVLSAPTVAALLFVLLSGVLSMALVWSRVENHREDRSIHLDPQRATEGGGLAYQREMQAQYGRTRKLLKAMKIKCTKVSDGLACLVDLPEGD